MDQESVVIIDRREHQDSGDDFGLDPPVLQVPRDVVHEQRIGQTDILSFKIHGQLSLTMFWNWQNLYIFINDILGVFYNLEL